MKEVIFSQNTKRMEFRVLKGTGEKVLFDREKLNQTLGSSGTGTDELEQIAQRVEAQIYNCIPKSK